jgi:hypothetical protein
MSDDEQMVIIGRMVMQRKALQQKSVALASEIGRASKAFQSLSGSLKVYLEHHHEVPLEVRPEIAEFMNTERLESLVKEYLQTGQELRDAQAALDQVT